jgi:hypothetical protein
MKNLKTNEPTPAFILRLAQVGLTPKDLGMTDEEQSHQILGELFYALDNEKGE